MSMAFEDAQNRAAQTSRIRKLLLYSLQVLLPRFCRRLICKGYLATLAKPHYKVSRLSCIVRLAVNNPTISSGAVRACPPQSASRYRHQQVARAILTGIVLYQFQRDSLKLFCAILAKTPLKNQPPLSQAPFLAPETQPDCPPTRSPCNCDREYERAQQVQAVPVRSDKIQRNQ